MDPDVYAIEEAMRLINPLPAKLADDKPDVAATIESALLCLEGAKRGVEVCVPSPTLDNTSQ